jgi:hypothetical protein
LECRSSQRLHQKSKASESKADKEAGSGCQFDLRLRSTRQNRAIVSGTANQAGRSDRQGGDIGCDFRKYPGEDSGFHTDRTLQHPADNSFPQLPYSASAAASSISVTGPSLISATPMQAPNMPFLAPVRSQKRSYSGSATSGRAAST